MALAFTVTLLEDHKGVSRPKAVGDEYVVDALVDVTSIVATGSIIPASEFGLSTITAAMITGHDNANGVQPQIECSATGAYESTTSLALMFTALDGTNATLSNDANGGSVRMRVYGNL
jgi:hypothetical protein|tara:strand:- start:282 stop:635 length:354 start_codon:yes stop_codon:yes gene_type:complete